MAHVHLRIVPDSFRVETSASLTKVHEKLLGRIEKLITPEAMNQIYRPPIVYDREPAPPVRMSSLIFEDCSVVVILYETEESMAVSIQYPLVWPSTKFDKERSRLLAAASQNTPPTVGMKHAMLVVGILIVAFVLRWFISAVPSPLDRAETLINVLLALDITQHEAHTGSLPKRAPPGADKVEDQHNLGQ